MIVMNSEQDKIKLQDDVHKVRNVHALLNENKSTILDFYLKSPWLLLHLL